MQYAFHRLMISSIGHQQYPIAVDLVLLIIAAFVVLNKSNLVNIHENVVCWHATVATLLVLIGNLCVNKSAWAV